MPVQLEKILIDERVREEPITRRILERTKGIPHIVAGEKEMEKRMGGISLSRGKRILYLTSHRGEWVKHCPGTLRPYLCCQYMIINQMIQCPMDCTYCVLQDYLDQPILTFHVKVSQIFDSIEARLSQEPHRFFRFGTGELSDSLVIDEITLMSRDYAHFFSSKKNALIELKTKSTNISQLLQAPTHHVVVSWSVNPQRLVETEEFLTASLRERLDSARRCMEKGLLLGFHFDPILWVPNWELLYHRLIQDMFSHVDASRIVWISLGSLRFPASLKMTGEKRFPHTRIFYEEMIRGLDGKYRYPKPMRVEMYQKIYQWLKEVSPDLFVYFCMESPWVWERVMGKSPRSNGELDFWFARSLYQRFPELDMEPPQRKYYPDSMR